MAEQTDVLAIIAALETSLDKAALIRFGGSLIEVEWRLPAAISRIREAVANWPVEVVRAACADPVYLIRPRGMSCKEARGSEPAAPTSAAAPIATQGDLFGVK